MTIGLIGRKCGMTRVFTQEGSSIPVTVIEIEPNIITQLKTIETDGYRAVQVTAGKRSVKRVTKPLAGHYSKVNVAPGRSLLEFRLSEGEAELKPGEEVKVDLFQDGQFVNVRSVSKGKGFAGVVKRHNFSMQDATHGNSLSHRAPGSIGQNQTPGRVFKGKKMAGRLGGKNCTVENQEIVQVDKERNLVLIKGTVPGAPGGEVVILPARKGKKSGGEK